jgi:glyoxylase-like metal-dependent hydrolase (beta-lactamase superfamily II)
MDGIRDLVQSLSSSTWRMVMVGTEQMTRAVALPITGALANLGEPFKSVASGAEDQISNAFQATTRVGDTVQRETVDLLFDLFTLKPLQNSLEETGLLSEASSTGYQSQPELEYLKVVNDAGPARYSLIILLLAVMYASLKRDKEGVEQFAQYLQTYNPQLSPNKKAVYLGCLALLRSSYARNLPIWQVVDIINAIQSTLNELKDAKAMTESEPDINPHDDTLLDDPPGKIVARWVSGLLHAQLPWPFGNRDTASQDLRWCDEQINKSVNTRKQLFFFLPEMYFSLALLYSRSGDVVQTERYLKLSGFSSFDKQILLAAPFGVTSDGLRVGVKHVTESIPGKIFTVSGHDMSEFNYVISQDGQQLMAIDMGSRVDTAEAAYQFLEKYLTDRGLKPPKLTTVFVTHTHWDHIGGHPFYKKLNPDVKFYSRDTYREQQPLSANQPPPFQWFLGVTFTAQNVATYAPDVIVTEADSEHDVPPPIECPPPIFRLGPEGIKERVPTTPSRSYPAQHAQLEIGGTDIELILPPGGGGETPDGMFIWLPEYSVLFAGDFIVPWIGTPYVVEGNIPSLLAAMDLVTDNLNPRYVLHGHEAVTVLLGSTEKIRQLRPQLTWLYCEVLELIYDFQNRPTIQEKNLIPPNLPQHPLVHLPYILMREVFINRLYRQTVGYWGPQLQGVDYLSDKEIGAIFAHYLNLSDEELAGSIKRMIKRGDHELAARTVLWSLTQYPRSEALKQVKQTVFQHLKQKWQQLNLFKFVMYSEVIGEPSPLAGTPAEPSDVIRVEFALDRVADPGQPAVSLQTALGQSNSVVFPPIGPAGGSVVLNDRDRPITALSVEILRPGDPKIPADFAQPRVVWDDLTGDGQFGYSNVFRRVSLSQDRRTITFDQGMILPGEFFRGYLPEMEQPIRFSAQAIFTFS